LSRYILPLLCLVLLAGPPLARPAGSPSLSADTGWQRIDEKSGVTLYSRTRVGTPIREFKGVGLIDAPPATVQAILDDVASYPQFMPYVVISRIISQAGNDDVTYQLLDIPFVSNRDYTVRVNHGTARNADGALIYRDTWQTDNDAGPPQEPGIVRVQVNEGSWLLEPAGPAGDSTQASYQIFTDSGGVIPAFLANRGSQVIIPRLFLALRKQALLPKYQH
jgi:ribosome-associated toxin RatA of RatAB toxin-antitoxin module